jgi:CRISPR/Cas system-associated exonuclease Cas4 (RecB family)
MNLDSTTMPWLHLLLVGLLVLATLGLWIRAERWFQRHQRRRRWSRAQAAEAAAPRLLERLGYNVLEAQVEGSYSVIVDSEAISVSLRADYLVERAGFRYIAEVKSGKSATKLENAATRRQLLEYLVAFEVQGVLLVDGETERVHEVVFPLSSRARTSVFGKWLAAVVALALIAFAGYWLRH